jgi:hypothetical protein
VIDGSCLCGAVRFRISHASGPFELCHCSRCRKASGSAFAAWIDIDPETFELLQGRELIQAYEAPLREKPPPYRRCFCKRCGSAVPDVLSGRPVSAIPAGTLDDDPGIRPDKHIYVELKAPWYRIEDSLPQMDKAALTRDRAGRGRT